MCKIYGYARVSRRSQNIERQVRNIKDAYPDAVIITEAYTGTKIQGREKFERLCKKVKRGDIIVFDSVSRMSRSAQEGYAQYVKFFDAGVELVFLKEPGINTETYKAALDKKVSEVSTGDAAADALVNSIMDAVSAYMMRLAERQIMLAFEQAQKEVDDLHQRTKEGIREKQRYNEWLIDQYGSEEEARKDPGWTQIGQQKKLKLNVKKAASAKDVIRQHAKEFGGTLDDPEVIKLAGCSRNSYYKYKRELREE